MEKKVKLRLPDKLYHTLLEASKKESMEIENYIIKVLEKNESPHNQVELLKEIVLKDLQELMIKIKKNQQPYSKNLNRNFKMISLEEYDKDIPALLKSNIDSYKKMQLFNEKYFYLLVDKNTIIGYLGMDFHEEPMPFGSYGFIYCLNIERSYNTRGSLQKIITFLQKSLKNKKIYNIDIASSSSTLTKDLLTQLDFSKFYSTHRVKANIINNIQDSKFPKYNGKVVEFNKNNLQNLLPASRKFPLNYLLDYWNNDTKALQCKKVNFCHDNKIKEFIIITNKTKKESIYNYTVLIKPLDLFNEEILKGIYKILIKEIKINSLKNTFIIDVPEEIKDFLDQYINIISINHNSWYRKIYS